jgi:hypothetical protein
MSLTVGTFNTENQSMRPLVLVSPVNLIPGKHYLIQEKRPEYAHLNCKGIFLENKYPEHSYQCTLSKFENVTITGNKKYPGQLNLQDTYWNYYEADATIRAYTNQVLREITGDPSFVMN